MRPLQQEPVDRESCLQKVRGYEERVQTKKERAETEASVVDLPPSRSQSLQCLHVKFFDHHPRNLENQLRVEWDEIETQLQFLECDEAHNQSHRKGEDILRRFEKQHIQLSNVPISQWRWHQLHAPTEFRYRGTTQQIAAVRLRRENPTRWFDESIFRWQS